MRHRTLVSSRPRWNQWLLGHVALGDRDEAREPGFRRQQVVERGVEPPRPLGVGEPVADREDLPLPVVEEPEVHRVRRSAQRARQASAARAAFGRASARQGPSASARAPVHEPEWPPRRGRPPARTHRWQNMRSLPQFGQELAARSRRCTGSSGSGERVPSTASTATSRCPVGGDAPRARSDDCHRCAVATSAVSAGPADLPPTAPGPAATSLQARPPARCSAPARLPLSTVDT